MLPERPHEVQREGEKSPRCSLPLTLHVMQVLPVGRTQPGGSGTGSPQEPASLPHTGKSKRMMRNELRDCHGGQEAGKFKKGIFVASDATGRFPDLRRSIPGLGDESIEGKC